MGILGWLAGSNNRDEERVPEFRWDITADEVNEDWAERQDRELQRQFAHIARYSKKDEQEEKPWRLFGIF